MTSSVTSPLFDDRQEAGRRLGVAVRALRLEDPLVLGIPTGGVAVAAEVSRALGAPLDIWVSRKLTPPDTEDLPVGALAEAGGLCVDPERADGGEAAWEHLAVHAALASREVLATAQRLREGRPRPCVTGRDVVVVDDVVATGVTAHAVLHDLHGLRARRVVLASPVGDANALRSLAEDASDVVCLAPLERLRRAEALYIAFPPIRESDVVEFLRTARRRAA